MTAAPVRTCAGCGRKAAKAELVRFVAPDGVLTAADKAPGRGVYTCRRLSCYERALSRRAFARTLRRPIRVEPGLVERLGLQFNRVDRSVPTDAQAKPARPGKAPTSGA